MARILTVTVNPTLDVSSAVQTVVHDRKLRCAEPRREPGGGGLNVARAIRLLGGEADALWTRGGHSGALVADLLDREGVTHIPVQVSGTTRESLMIFERSSGEQYRFLFPGPRLTGAEIAHIEAALADRHPRPEYLVLSGSLPPDAPDDLYARLAAAGGAPSRVIVDTSGEALRRTVREGVFLIKPNVGELQALVGRPLESDAEIERAASELLTAGRTRMVVVSLGAGGAIVATAEGCAHVRSPTVPIRSRVGAGDSMVAGMVLALSRGLGNLEAVRFGVAAGAAAVMTPGSELCRRADAEQLHAVMPAPALHRFPGPS